MAREHTEPEHWARLRERLVRHLSARHDLDDPQVLAALGRVPRERFIPEPWREYAYADKALPIEHDQTISQPYIVALMSQCAGVGPGSRVLEVGTGCGYQTAVLAELGAEVFTIEIVEPLAHAAARLLAELGYHTVHTRVGDGHRGWPEAAPFDAIVVTAAPRAVPSTLVEQLALGGRLVLPVGDEDQDLLVLTRTAQGVRTEHVAAVRFVPMTGRAGASFVAEPGSDKLPAWR